MTDLVALPNSSFGRTTETAGLVEIEPTDFASWLVSVLGEPWSSQPIGPATVTSHISELIEGGSSKHISKYLVLGVRNWVLLLTDGPLGTDLGVIPSRVARDLDVVAVRATAVDPDAESFGAAIFELFDPKAEANPQLCRRAVYAADDGGHWRFSQSGEPLPFEDSEGYRRHKVRDRLSPGMVRLYLQQIGAPFVSVDLEAAGYLVERE